MADRLGEGQDEGRGEKGEGGSKRDGGAGQSVNRCIKTRIEEVCKSEKGEEVGCWTNNLLVPAPTNVAVAGATKVPYWQTEC